MPGNTAAGPGNIALMAECGAGASGARLVSAQRQKRRRRWRLLP
jgi:hypothetical protein